MLNLEELHSLSEVLVMRVALLKGSITKLSGLIDSARLSAAESSIASTMGVDGDGSVRLITGVRKEDFQSLVHSMGDVARQHGIPRDVMAEMFDRLKHFMLSTDFVISANGGSETQPPHSDAQQGSLPGESSAVASPPVSSPLTRVVSLTDLNAMLRMAVEVHSGLCRAWERWPTPMNQNYIDQALQLKTLIEIQLPR